MDMRKRVQPLAERGWSRFSRFQNAKPSRDADGGIAYGFAAAFAPLASTSVAVIV